MTSEQSAGTAQAAWVGYSATAHGLNPDEIQLHRDEHGAAHIYLDDRRDMDIRIQVDEGRYDTPEQHAADLERDRQALLRLAEIATQLAGEIGQRQREGGAS
ncbi:MAG TPA: hypothetical protein VFY14_08935 [Streptomyces sp.]|nr:hypothetical protein [Streptomyces sp.]